MSVYVDSLVNWPHKTYGYTARYFGNNKPSCHMTADTLKELIDMAHTIGLKSSWLHHSNSGIAHFDLTPSKRRLAIQCGAIERD